MLRNFERRLARLEIAIVPRINPLALAINAAATEMGIYDAASWEAAAMQQQSGSLARQRLSQPKELE